MSKRRVWLPEQDAALLQATAQNMREYSVEWGIPYTSLDHRRILLRKNVRRREDDVIAERDRTVEAERRFSGRFARPGWFDEDLRALTKGAI